MRLIITGYTGFIGRNVLRAVLKSGIAESVLCIARRTVPVDEPIVECHSVDLSGADFARLENLIERFDPDAVVNCSGFIPLTPLKLEQSANAKAPMKYRHSDLRSPIVEATTHNILATTNLLEALSRVTENVRFIQIGTAAEYGQSVMSREPIREDCRPNPTSIYGITKLAATQLVFSFGAAREMRPTVLRFFNPIGIDAPETTLFGRALTLLQDPKIRERGVLTFGNLDSYRDFIDIEDIAFAIIATLRENELSIGEIINIGSGKAIMARKLITELIAHAKCDCKIVELSENSGCKSSPTWSVADINKAKKMLSWSPKHTLGDTLISVVEKLSTK